MELQELVARARLLFTGAPKRFQVFDLVNGRKSAKEIARKCKRSLSVTLRDLQKMKDLELIFIRKKENGKIFKKDNSMVYKKNPLLKHLSYSYLKDPTKIPISRKYQRVKRKGIRKVPKAISVPNEQEILEICRSGESQIYEFKRAGEKMDHLSKEICAFANTKMGGFIFYGVEDDGAITGSNKHKQSFDQSLQNSIRYNISPALSVKIIEKDVLGHKIILVNISPWDRKTVYHFKGTVYIRKGTNVFSIKPEESKKLHAGECVI